nr:hypothetical protein [Pseudoalteromonas sp. WY3]
MNSSHVSLSNRLVLHQFLAIFIAICAFNTNAQQTKSEKNELARMQAQLNAEVMSRPFLAEKPEEVDAYIKVC